MPNAARVKSLPSNNLGHGRVPALLQVTANMAVILSKSLCRNTLQSLSRAVLYIH